MSDFFFFKEAITLIIKTLLLKKSVKMTFIFQEEKKFIVS